VNARYAGDDTFAASTSTPGVPVVVAKENSRLQYGIVTFDPVTNAITSTNATSFAYGSPYILRIDILNNTGNACQAVVVLNGGTGTTAGCAFDATGTVTITDNGNPLDAGAFPVNSAGSGEDQPIQLTGGTHALSATYSGDISYNAVATAVLDSVTVSKATTATTVTGPSATTSGTMVTLTAQVQTSSNGAGPTGMVSFTNGSASLGSANCVPTDAVFSTSGTLTPAFCTATLSTAISALYPPPIGEPKGPGLPVMPVILALVSLLLFALGLRWVPERRRRAFAVVSFVAFVAFAGTIAGCGGGSGGGGGGGGGGTTRTIHASYPGDTNYSASSGSVSITVH
jgi:hypothetical protein